LILVSIDGYRADYLDRGHSPVLAALAAGGVRAKGMRPVFPSLTYPNHYTLATGLYPDQHGVVNNTMHDPVLGNFSPSNRAANTDGRWWDRAEPIWVTAQKQGLRTASVFYPGTQAEIRGVRPAYWQLFDSSVPPDDRVDQVLTWLDLPPDQRPRFVSLYFEQVDVAGHNYGPDSLQVDEAMVTVDAALGRLVAGLRQRNVFDTTNLIILSDHGMSASSPERMVLLDSIVDVEHIELTSSIVNAAINPKPGYAAEVEREIADRFRDQRFVGAGRGAVIVDDVKDHGNIPDQVERRFREREIRPAVCEFVPGGSSYTIQRPVFGSSRTICRP